MEIVRWIAGFLCIAALAALNILAPHLSLLLRFANPLFFACFLCVLRIIAGPSAADRAVAVDMMGVMIIGLCGILAVFTKYAFFIDIGIAWALQSFIAGLALAKYLEGRNFND